MFLDFFRMRRQAPTTKPPKGYYDLRVSKATGALVLVDETGTEAAVGQVTSVAGRTGAVTIASADITDATTTPTTAKVVLYTSQQGLDTKVMRMYDGVLNVEITPSGLTANRALEYIDASGTIAVVGRYDDQDAANLAEDANVVYYNDATGKFQITTA